MWWWTFFHHVAFIRNVFETNSNNIQSIFLILIQCLILKYIKHMLFICWIFFFSFRFFKFDSRKIELQFMKIFSQNYVEHVLNKKSIYIANVFVKIIEIRFYRHHFEKIRQNLFKFNIYLKYVSIINNLFDFYFLHMSIVTLRIFFWFSFR